MRAGRTHSIVFTPPETPRETIERVKLYEEPAEELLLLGLMIEDIALVEKMLRTLPFARDDYRGNLRVIRGAARRMIERTARLLGEKES